MNLSGDDKLTFKKIKSGDISAFEMLFKENYRNLCYYAEDIVREKAAAEEMVSDFFLKFWEERENIEIRISLTAYMYTCVRNNCLKYLEHLKVLQKYKAYATYSIQNSDLLFPTSAFPINRLISKEIVSDIESAIELLPEQCRIIFNKSRFEELTYEEISKELNISINTVRTQMSRALVKLRESLKEYLPTVICFFFAIFCNFNRL
ncbi:MAG: RNA polymerase sigma-70 factor [Bacteroidetes bacterium]|nr:RNA polymerase sigma-70 factor [Bacteroidota bacterium]